jgi:hypothetical protein
LGGFLRHTYHATIDHLVDMYQKLMTATYRRAEPARETAVKRSRAPWRGTLQSFHRLGQTRCDDTVPPEAIRAAVFAHSPLARLPTQLQEAERGLTADTSDVFPLVMKRSSDLRQCAPRLLDHLAVDLEPTGSPALREALTILRHLNTMGRRTRPEDLPIGCIPRRLHPFVGTHGTRNRRAYECAVLTVLRMECPRPLVLLLDAGGLVVGPRLSGGLLSAGEHQRLRAEGTGREGHRLGAGGLEGSIPWGLGVQPPLLAPGLPVMSGQPPPPRGGRESLHAPSGEERPRACGTIPRGEATTPQSRPLAGEAHDVDRDRRGKHRPWPRDQGPLNAQPDAGRETAWPRGGPRSGARQRPAPRRMGRPRLPASGDSSPGGPSQRPREWTVAPAPASVALRQTGQGVRPTCGHVPS